MYIEDLALKTYNDWYVIKPNQIKPKCTIMKDEKASVDNFIYSLNYLVAFEILKVKTFFLCEA